MKNLITKKNFPEDQQSRILEDSLCLVFLKFQLTDFLKKTEEFKAINALKKSWSKMTDEGKEEALKIEFAPSCQELIKKSLNL